MSTTSRGWALGVVACLVPAALSALGPTTPGHDAWAWLIWGREIGHLDLDTAGGPALAPLAVLVTTILAPLGDGAPVIWVVLARAGALAAILAAGLLAHRLATGPEMPPGAYVLPAARPRPVRPWWHLGLRLGRTLGRRWWPWLPGSRRTPRPPRPVPPGSPDPARLRAGSRAAGLALLAALGTTGLVWQGWQGGAEGLAAAAGLLALERAAAGQHRAALAAVVVLCLLRVEGWPFALFYGGWLWRTQPAWRPALVAVAAGVLVVWCGPELWGSGDLLRAGSRAPGHESSALGALGDALRLPLGAALLATVLGAATVRPGVVLPLVVAGTWIVLVALMAQAGFSGGARDQLPGAVMLGVAGAVGLAGMARRRDPRWAAVATVLALALAGQAVARAVGGVPDRWDQLQTQRDLADALPDAIARAGGRRALLHCGRPVTTRALGPMLAWHLRVHQQRIASGPHARGAGAVFAIRAGRWRVTHPPRC